MVEENCLREDGGKGFLFFPAAETSVDFPLSVFVTTWIWTPPSVFGGGAALGLLTAFVAFRVGSLVIGVSAGIRCCTVCGVYESLDTILLGWASMPELCVESGAYVCGIVALRAASRMPELAVDCARRSDGVGL